MANVHQKRLAAPKSWPIERKSNIYTAKLRPGSHNKEQALPLNVLLKEVLKKAGTSREVRYLLKENPVFIGGKRRTDYRYPVGLFETVTFESTKECYRLVFDRLGHLACVSVGMDEASKRVARVQAISQVKGGKTQYHLFGGRNVLLDKQKKEYRIGDSLVLDAKDAVVEHLPLKKGSQVYFIKGKFVGTVATVEDVQGKDILVTSKAGTAKTLTEYAYVVGEKAPVMTLV